MRSVKLGKVKRQAAKFQTGRGLFVGRLLLRPSGLHEGLKSKPGVLLVRGA